jgi:hypothetical protein
MSVERFVSISHPFGERTLNFRAAFISTALIWTVGLALSLIPGSIYFVHLLFYFSKKNYDGRSIVQSKRKAGFV